ncbi:MAG: Uma2 family endonuclease, partial [Chitinophagaceae bacterium]|nr:Uma2 family endonuclease [Anaerolineae bacterium]
MQTIQEQERVGMPLAEFIAEFERKPFEIINGERIVKMPGVYSHILMIRLLFRLLDQFTQAHQLGEVFQEATFILPDTYSSDWVKGSRIPDILFISAAKMVAS